MKVIIHHPQKRTEAPLCLEALELGEKPISECLFCV